MDPPPEHGHLSADGWLRVGVPLGALLYIVALAGSAMVVAPLRPLHFFQALIYVAIIVLARRGSIAALGAGVAVPLVWNVMELFVTHLAQAGAREFWSFVQTGHTVRIDTMMVTLGTLAHVVLIVSCLGVFVGRRGERRAWLRFAGGTLASLAYFALIVATLLPS